MKKIIVLLIGILSFYSCDLLEPKDEDKVPYNGHLEGEVKYTGASSMEVDNVIITLRGDDDETEAVSKRITRDGKYDLELPAGKYIMELKGNRCKSDELPYEVKIVANETRIKDINIEQLPSSMVIFYNDVEYKSGDMITLSGGVALDIWNKYGSNNLRWNIRAYPQPSWITFEQTNGTVTGGGRKSVIFSLDKSKMPEVGLNYSDVILTTEDNGSFTVIVEARNDGKPNPDGGINHIDDEDFSFMINEKIVPAGSTVSISDHLYLQLVPKNPGGSFLVWWEESPQKQYRWSLNGVGKYQNFIVYATSENEKSAPFWGEYGQSKTIVVQFGVTFEYSFVVTVNML